MDQRRLALFQRICVVHQVMGGHSLKHGRSGLLIGNPGWHMHKPVGGHGEMTTTGWLRADVQVVGVTAGASTPNVKVGETIARIFATRGIDLAGALG